MRKGGIIIIILVVMSLSSYQLALSDPIDYESWTYRRKIEIHEESGVALTDYPILIEYDFSSLISEGKIRSDLGDLRFTDENGNLLNYHISEINNNIAKIYIKIPQIPAGGNITIYMYYGNPSATSAESSLWDIGIITEDWTEDSFPSDKWILNDPDYTTFGDLAGEFQPDHDRILLAPNQQSKCGNVVPKNYELPEYGFYLKARFEDTGNSDGFKVFFYATASGTSNGVELRFNGYYDEIVLEDSDGIRAQTSWSVEGFNIVLEMYVVKKSNGDYSVKVYFDGELKIDYTGSLVLKGSEIALTGGHGGAAAEKYLWGNPEVTIKPYIDPAPTYTIYSEERVYLIKFDDGTLCNSTIYIDAGGGVVESNYHICAIESSKITSEYLIVSNETWSRRFKVGRHVLYVPQPDQTYTNVLIIINDYTGEFEGGWLKVYDSAQRLIQEEIIPLDYKVSCYLKLYETYKLVVEKDNEERVLGYVTIDQENKTITSYIGTTPPTYSEILEGVNYNVTDTGTSIMVTVTSEEPIDVLIKIYNQTGEEFSHSSSNVETVSITHTYSEKTFRTVEITVTDPETGESKKVTYYVGTGVTQPFTLERTPNPLQLFNITFFSIPYEIRQLGLENILVYCTGIVIFLILCTKYTLGVGCIGAGITILFMKAWIGNVTYPDLIASVVIVLGGLYEFTRRR
ncbi:MAG: hypothetical protein DRJ62_06885 [Thermoprotei archaeon]|nr:MAG: hypothetical protein DRJ62_06885 [Thermoprotei archaeon]